MAAKYRLFYMPACPFCQKVLRWMDAQGIAFGEGGTVEPADITADPACREELARVGGKVQVPCLLIDGKPMYESDDVIAYLRDNVA